MPDTRAKPGLQVPSLQVPSLQVSGLQVPSLQGTARPRGQHARPLSDLTQRRLGHFPFGRVPQFPGLGRLRLRLRGLLPGSPARLGLARLGLGGWRDRGTAPGRRARRGQGRTESRTLRSRPQPQPPGPRRESPAGPPHPRAPPGAPGLCAARPPTWLRPAPPTRPTLLPPWPPSLSQRKCGVSGRKCSPSLGRMR